MSIVDLRLKKIDELEARILKLQKIYPPSLNTSKYISGIDVIVD